MIPVIALVLAVADGLLGVAILIILQVVAQLVRPEWTSLPISVWWGALLGLPALALAAYSGAVRL